MSACTLCTWEATSALFAGAYLNGGPASVVYGFIVSVLGTLCIATSMAEMASMCVLGPASLQKMTDEIDIVRPLPELNTTGALSTHRSDGAPSLATFRAGSPSRDGLQLLPPCVT